MAQRVCESYVCVSALDAGGRSRPQHQKRTSSAFGISVQVPSEGVTVDQGTPTTRVRIADSGNERIQHFCGDCGTSLFGTGEATTHITVIYAGSLDDPGGVPILANIWTDSALPWVPMAPDVERFPKGPDFAKYYVRDD
jgi:hypothetical protein